jgi:RNA polymerase sigma-70 factor (ECF subfamily)
MGTTDTRYAGLAGGRFHRKAGFDQDLRPGELAGAVARAKQGDRDALRYIYLRFADNVYGYVRSIVRDEHEAEDITQQVFARLITALKSYEQRSVPFSAWLLRIAHNMSIDHLRRRVTLCEEPDVSEGRTDDRSHELSMALREALETLPDVQRRVLIMRHWFGCSPGEIAAALDRSEDSIHGLHHRGRRALREALADVDAAPMTIAA